jgi:hypothetical protein
MIANIKNPLLRKLAVIGGVILVGPFAFVDYFLRGQAVEFWDGVRFAWRGR